MRSRSNGGVIGAYALPSQNFANGVFFIHDAAIYNTGANPIWPLGTGYIYSATGGTITTAADNTNYKTHTFTANGTFTITTGSGYIDILLVGGGGSGGAAGDAANYSAKGGGGAGGSVVLATNVFVNGPTSFTVQVGAGGTAITTATRTSMSTGLGAGALSKVTSSSGYSFTAYGGGPGESTYSGTLYYYSGNSLISGGGSAQERSQTGNTAHQPFSTRTFDDNTQTGGTITYQSNAAGGYSFYLGISGMGNAGGGAGAQPGYSGDHVTYPCAGGDGYLWNRTNEYYGAGGGGGTVYGWPTTRASNTNSRSGLYGASLRNNTSGGWCYNWTVSGATTAGSAGANGYGVGGGGAATYGATSASGGAGGSGVVIFCYRYK